MKIFHVALAREWDQATVDGTYTTSTLGVSLEEEGFIHASRKDQWPGVLERFYGGVTEPLVLLVIDTSRLSSPVVEETPPGASETFPHVYGPIDVSAVVEVRRLDRSFSSLFFEELFRNVLLAVLVLGGAIAGALLLDGRLDGWGRLVGALVGVLVGALVVRRARRPRRRRPS